MSSKPFWVESISGAAALEVDADGSGKHGITWFKAVPMQFTKADGAESFNEVMEKLDTTATNQIEVRNTFQENMTAGERLLIELDENGIGNIIVWECDN